MMSPRQPTEQHSNQRDVEAQRASWRRKNHAHIEAMQNLIISAIASGTGEEMPPKCRLLLSAIQGAHGGGEVINEEFSRSYLALAAQLQFTGTEDARRSRVRDWVDAFDDWQAKTYLLVSVIKGGKIIGRAEGGDPVREATRFIDHVKPIADDAVMSARATAEWKVNPGRALAAQSARAVKQLSRHPEYVEPVPADAVGVSDADAPEQTEEDLIAARLTVLREYVEGREDRMFKDEQRVNEKFCEGDLISDTEIDGRMAALDVHYAKAVGELKKSFAAARQYLSKQRRTRLVRAMNVGDAEDDAGEADQTIDAADSGTLSPALFADAQARHGESGGRRGNYHTRNFLDVPDGEVEEVIGGGVGWEKLTQATQKAQ
jgi:hypothetical protein